MEKADHLIVGQGIVGSALALELLRLGKSVAIIDEPKLSSSSRIAGGVYNPFNFKFMMDLWRAKEMVGCAKDLYQYAEKISGRKIHTERRIHKILTEAERKQWEHAVLMRTGIFADEEFSNDIPDGVIAPHGIGIVNGAGNIDCVGFLDAARDRVEADGNYFHERFDHALLDLSSGEAHYDGRIMAKRITFCEGHLGRLNPLFDHIPFRQAKGQLLIVEIPGLEFNDVLSRGVSLLPLGNSRFILSGTFENGFDDEEITVQAEEELLTKAKKFISLQIHVKDHLAGVRPAVADRRAVIGTHPEYKQVSIINGTGSRSVLMAPFLAKCLAENFESDIPIPSEVSVNRFLRIA